MNGRRSRHQSGNKPGKWIAVLAVPLFLLGTGLFSFLWNVPLNTLRAAHSATAPPAILIRKASSPENHPMALDSSFLAGIPRYKLQMVRTQRERGFRTYALSNINDVVFPFVRDVLFTQEGLQLDDYFEKAYLSYEMHELKPSPEIYRKMIEKSGMRPEATLFIDDNAENLHTAQELGFHVYMPRPREDFRFLFDDGPGR